MAANVIESIHKVLIEFETRPRELENLCFLTFADVPDIREKLDFSGPSAAYVTRLIRVLANYGRLPDKTHALVKLLEALKAHWGIDKQARIDELIAEFEQSCAASPPQRTSQTLLPIGPNPYRGLHAFREEDAGLFFGRDEYIEQLAQAVQEHPLTAVIGASGSGKSSLVRAGLIPRLRRQGNWRVIAFRPGLFASERNPLLPLALALRKALAPDQDEVERLSKAVDLTKKLKNGDCTLAQILSLLREKEPNTSILLFADQFEELYTTCLDDLEEQHRFLDALLPTVGVQTSVCKFLLTMRADFLSKALAYRPFADALQGRDLKIGPMQREELRQAIEQPAALRNVQIEDGLTDRILEAVAAKPGELPLVQFTLTELWLRQTPPAADSQGRLTHAAYEEIGGVQQALAQYAEREFNKLTKDEQQRAQSIFTQLVQPGAGTEDTRRIATRAEIGEADWPLVAKLADARLVVTGQEAAYTPESPPGRGRGGSPAQPPTSPPGRGRGGSPAQPPDSRTHPLPLPGGELAACGDSPDATTHPLPLPGGELDAVPCDTVDVAHEALIRGWQRLREWIDADREFRAWQERLRSALRQWQANNYDDGALLRGAPLAEAEQWLHARAFTRPEEPQFIQASLDLRDREQREREAQQQRELELARKAAREERQRVEVQTRANKQQRIWSIIATLLAVAAIVAAIGAYWQFLQANREKAEAEHQTQVALVHLVTASANERVVTEEREKAALLARQAYELNRVWNANAKAQIVKVLGMALALPNEDADTLVDQVCQQAMRDLTTEEWQAIINRDDIRYTPCPDLVGSEKMLRLRSEPMTTDERQHLSLNVRTNGSVATDIQNDFQDLSEVNTSVAPGEVIIDHATGLMWEQAGSRDSLTYEAAQDYIKQLNEEELGGYRGWRLPTVEELLSLVEKNRNEADLSINSIFDNEQRWCWSSDRIKGEGSAESAWSVHFNLGNVDWYLLNLYYYVRAVRSWQ